MVKKIINYKGFKFTITPWQGDEKVLLAYNPEIDKQLSNRSIKELRKEIKKLVDNYIQYERLKMELYS